MRTNEKGMIDLLLIGAIVIVLIVGGFVLWQLQDSDEVAEVESNSPQLTTEVVETPEESVETSQPAEGVETPVPRGSAELLAVNGFDASGTATRAQVGESGYQHEVIAQLPPSPEGTFYEGWIVGSSVVSTGELTQEGDGESSLVFESQEDLFSHDEVVITQETLANGLDGVPEVHVLEGTFVE